MNMVKKPTVLFERFPYRYVECGTLEINGMPDYRIQKANEYTKRYSDCLLYTSPSPRDLSTSRMPSSA